MTTRPEYGRGKRDGIRWAITWLHNRANEMNDPHAKLVLDAAGFNMGVEAKQANFILAREPDADRSLLSADSQDDDTR